MGIATKLGSDLAFNLAATLLQTTMQIAATIVSQEQVKEIGQFYAGKNWSFQQLVIGKNHDFQIATGASTGLVGTIDNMARTAQAIASAIYSVGTPPAGVTVNRNVIAGKGMAANPDCQLYVTQKVIAELSDIVLDIGTPAADVHLTTGSIALDLCYGMRLFAKVFMSASRSPLVLENSLVSQYLFDYVITYSLDGAKTQASQAIEDLYANQIQVFVEMKQKLASKLESGELTPEEFASQTALYDKMIAAAKVKMATLLH